MSADRRGPPEDLTVRDAVQKYLGRLRRDRADATVDAYRLDLRQFVLWCEDEGIEQVSDLTGYDFELYETDRSEEIASTSLENQMGLVKRFIEFCEDIGVVADGLHESVHVPRAPVSEQSRDDKLATEDAKTLLKHFRKRSNGLYGTKWHAVLEVAWHVGARIGGLRALDLDDYDSDFRVLEFRHRPNTGTPLKNKLGGERDVGILPEVSEVLDTYIEEHRH
ncbi:site-specific integrase, partial [Natronomonas gomsonensis]